MKQKKTEHKLTREEAIAMLRRAGTGCTYHVSIRVNLPIEGDPEHVFDNGGASYVNLSKKEAIKLVGDLMTDAIEKKGGRIPIRTYEGNQNCYWGARSIGERHVTSFWIG